MVCSLVATPRPVSAGTSCGRIARSGGRARAGKTSAPMLSLSQDVPAGPTVEIKCTDRAERNWPAGLAKLLTPHLTGRKFRSVRA